MNKVLLSLALTLLLPLTLTAAIPDMKFRRLDTRDGLSNSQVLTIYRDTKGFVWIGTAYGLNRYDGYRVKTYYYNLRDTTTLRSNYVEQIFENGDGCLWLKQGMSYSIFDPVTERCDRHPERILEKLGITGGIEYLFMDSMKDFWVKTYVNGFFHYNAKNKRLKQFRFGYDKQEIYQEIGVSGMAEFGNMVVLASNKGEVVTFDRDRDVIVSKDNYLPTHGLTNDQNCVPRFDRDGNLWIITNGGTYLRDKKSGQWHHSALQVLREWGINNVPDEASIWDMVPDDKQRIWLATDHGGLFVVDFASHDMRQFLNNKYDETSLSDNTLRNLYIDQLGRVWIGSYQNGVNLYTGNTSSIRNLELGVINTVCHDRRGFSWLGTNDAGIIRYDNRTGEQVVYNKENSGIGSNTMVGSLVARDGTVWFGTYEGGLIHFHDGQITNYRATGDTLGLANNNVWTVCEDQWGNIWIGTLGSGVQRIDRRTGKMRTFRISNSRLSSDYISTITMTKKGWLLVGHSKYYSLINPKTFRIVNRDVLDGLANVGGIEMSILTKEDSRELIWQGTTSGASVWDPKQNRFYLIDMRSGLLGSTVNGIEEDDNHTMWLVTDHGISNVIPQQQDDGSYQFIVRSYNNRDGLQNGPYNQRSTCFTKGGLLLVGGQGGLDVLNTAGMGKGRTKELPVFSGLMVADQDVAVGEEVDGRVILDKSLHVCKSVNLRYKDQFTIQLASTSGEIHNPSRFYYMLEGVSDKWGRTSELNPNLNFMSLRYGDYTLRVRMMNNDGTMGDDEAELDIHVAAPFWRARWAILFYILVVLAVALLWRRWFLRRQQEHEELEHQRRDYERLQWMGEMRAQMAADGAAQQSAVELEQLTYKPDEYELVGFVKYAVEVFKMPDGKSCKITFQSAVNRVEMRFDRSLVARMIDILLNNAVHFSPRGSRIKVNIAKVGDDVEISFTDRGLGIPEEARAHMFEPIADAGLGLNTVMRIAQLHGGDVRAADNPNGGTVFTVKLPAPTKPADDDIPIEEAVIIE